MKMRILTCTLTALLLSACSTPEEKRVYRLWFDREATRFEELLPLGNGRIGMMPGGGVHSEKIPLNEISLWSGSKHDFDNPDALKHLPRIRQLLFEGKNGEAQELVYKTFVCKDNGSANPIYGSYQVLGDLNLTYHYPNVPTAATVDNYIRELVLDDATAHTTFSINGVTYTRDYFTSFNDDVAIIRLKASGTGNLSFDATMDRAERFTITTDTLTGQLDMYGELNSGVEGKPGMRYAAKIRIITDGVREINSTSISIKEANEAILYLSMATSYNENNEQESAQRLLTEAMLESYNSQWSTHQLKFQNLFSRCDINLGNHCADSLTTDKRLLQFYNNNDQDPAMAALYFQFGRYLLISSTREGSLPPNLQGLWAHTIKTPWNGDYHMNINVQMNHWPCEATNLPELHRPLIEQTASLVEPGKKTAKVFYDADGWVAHMMTNVWGFTSPGEHPSWGASNTGGAWNCQHLWDHYDYGRDRDYLKSIYPVMSESARFFLSMLVEEPTHGWLVTAPSTSPENAFLYNGKPVSVCMAPTMDNQIIRELFTNTINAAEILEVDADLVEKMKIAIEKLPPHQIGEKGQLMEWLEDYEEAEPHHRHVSHLYGLHPGNQIIPSVTPMLADAARKTLERRGDGGTGWSRAWKVNFWARLWDGNHAYFMLTELLKPVMDNNFNYSNRGGTYPNLFNAHPPLQIDGNFGGTSGITEMLIQSHAGFVHFLPALPDAWPKGSFRGMRVRGGGEVLAKWDEGELTEFELLAHIDNTFTIKLAADHYSLKNSKGNADYQSLNDGYIVVTMKKGETLKGKLKS
ncbi:MAG: glycosyl hydrolase family 95 catalytic domain-containing protein [Bacteroidales bacterium]